MMVHGELEPCRFWPSDMSVAGLELLIERHCRMSRGLWQRDAPISSIVRIVRLWMGSELDAIRFVLHSIRAILYWGQAALLLAT